MEVLLDIIKFLKKLQSGQHDIEAGQFELYEGMENVNRALEELKMMKKDVDDMKASNAEQIGIIKDLEIKLNQLQKIYKNKGAKSHTTTYYSDGLGDGKKGFKKIHRRIEEVVDITSDVSNDRWSSEISDRDHSTWTEPQKPQNSRKVIKEVYASPQKNKRYHYCKNNEMLHRYLQDSAKYRERRISKASIASCSPVSRNVHARPSDSPCLKETEWEDANEDKRKYKQAISRTPKPAVAKTICCPFCYKRFTKGIDYSMHKKKHFLIVCTICRKAFANKERLKQHQMTHKNKRTKFEGFTCCYCHLICSTPEKLTAHLRKCRIITKTSPKRAPL